MSPGFKLGVVRAPPEAGAISSPIAQTGKLRLRCRISHKCRTGTRTWVLLTPEPHVSRILVLPRWSVNVYLPFHRGCRPRRRKGGAALLGFQSQDGGSGLSGGWGSRCIFFLLRASKPHLGPAPAVPPAACLCHCVWWGKEGMSFECVSRALGRAGPPGMGTRGEFPAAAPELRPASLNQEQLAVRLAGHWPSKPLSLYLENEGSNTLPCPEGL